MTRFSLGLSLGMLLALARMAGASTVSIDFTGGSPVSNGLTVVQNKDGAVLTAKRTDKNGVTKNVAVTGNSDGNQYLYLAIDPAFKQNLKSVWLTVEYFDEGTDAFQVDYDGQSDAYTATDGKAAPPATRVKYDTKQFTHQTWHLVDFKLAGSQEGGADLRIDDGKDGAELISKVSVSDQDPDFVHFPYAVNKITLNAKMDPAEGWDKAYTVTLANPTDPTEFSGTYRFLWDETSLYILGQVHDPTPRLNDQGGQSGGQYWNGDGMEQFIGLDDSDPEVHDLMVEGTDFKLTIGLGDPANGSSPPSWAVEDRGVFDPSVGNPTMDLGPIKDNIAIVNTKDGQPSDTGANGYDFEMRIPWNIHNAGDKVTAGQRIRWHMYANNSKSKTLPSSQDEAFSPSGRANFNRNPAAWYRGMLDPKP